MEKRENNNTMERERKYVCVREKKSSKFHWEKLILTTNYFMRIFFSNPFYILLYVLVYNISWICNGNRHRNKYKPRYALLMHVNIKSSPTEIIHMYKSLWNSAYDAVRMPFSDIAIYPYIFCLHTCRKIS